MTAVLRFEDVSCRFDGEDVVDGVSFEIAAGELVCLLGPSGCGKTTSLRLAAGMETPSAGTVWLDGAAVSTPQHVTPPEQRGIGFLFQDFALFPHLSVIDNVMFGLHDLPAEARKARALELLKAVELTGFADKFPSTLSGGEQQRTALARAMAPQPKLLLMDEPFSNLDPQLRDQMRDLTLRLLKENGAAGLIVTHDPADALRMADRIAVQSAGRILQMDAPDAIYKKPVDLQVAAMFGPVNLMPEGDGLRGVRPADISLAGADDDFVFEAELTEARPAGPACLCRLQLADGLVWQAMIHSDAVPPPGRHKFFVPQARLMLLKAQ